MRNLLNFLRGHTFLALLGKNTCKAWADSEHFADILWHSVGVLPQGSLALDCIAYDVFRCVNHPLVEAEDSTTLALDQLVESAAAHVAKKHTWRLDPGPLLGRW